MEKQVFYVYPDGTCATIDQTHQLALRANEWIRLARRISAVFTETVSNIADAFYQMVEKIKGAFSQHEDIVHSVPRSNNFRGKHTVKKNSASGN